MHVKSLAPILILPADIRTALEEGRPLPLREALPRAVLEPLDIN